MIVLAMQIADIDRLTWVLIFNKKAELSQRWPRNAPWVPWKFSGVPDYAHGYFSRNF